MKKRGMRCLAALLLSLLLTPSALAGRVIYNGEEALRDGDLYPCYVEEQACLIDAAGNEYACDGYESIFVAVSDSGLRRFIALKAEGTQRRCYLLDERGNPLTDGDCQYISVQGDDLIFVKENGLAGAYGWDGELLVEPVYPTVYPVGDGSYLALREPNWEIREGRAERLWPGQAPQSVVLGDGNVEYLGSFDDGLGEAIIQDGEEHYLSGLIDADGQWRVAPVYSYLDDMGGGYCRVIEDDRYGLIDRDGEVVLPVQYEDITACWDRGQPICLAALQNETVTVYDARTREKLFDVEGVRYCWFDFCNTALHVRDLDDEHMRVFALDGSLLSGEGNDSVDVTALRDDRVLTCNYDTYEYTLKDPEGSVLLSGVGSPSCVMGETGACAVLVYTARMIETPYGVYMPAMQHGRYGLYDLDGRELLPPKYDSIRQLCEGLYEVTRGQWTGVVDGRGEWILRRSVYTSLMD